MLPRESAKRLPVVLLVPGGGSHGLGIVRSGWPERGYQEATPGGMTPLLYAARDGRTEIAQMLIAAGAKVNAPDANKITPLLMAITNNQPDVGRSSDPERRRNQ